MRKIILLLAVVSLSKLLFAQNDNHSAIPQNIISAFSARYPNMPVQQWKSKKDAYTAKFTLDGKKSMAYYTAKGDWIKTERKIKWTWNLPATVKKGWEKSEFIRWYVEDMKEVDTQGQQIYVMHVNNGPTLYAEHQNFQEEYRLYFAGNGDLIKKEKCDE